MQLNTLEMLNRMNTVNNWNLKVQHVALKFVDLVKNLVCIFFLLVIACHLALYFLCSIEMVLHFHTYHI